MVFAMMTWGAGWPVLKILSENVSWEVATFWRLALMSIAFLPVLWWNKKPLYIAKPAWIWVILSGLLYALFSCLSFLGVEVATAGAGGMIITTLSPVISVLIAIVFTRFRPTVRHMIGLGLGLVGGAVMVELWDGNLLTNSGNLIFIVAALTWSVVGVLSQYAQVHLDPIRYTFFLGLIATAVMFFVAYPHGILQVFDQGVRFWSALLYLAIMTQTVASTIYFVASGKIGSAKAGSYMLLVPLFALISSYILLDEVPSRALLVGGAMGIAAVYVINQKRPSA